MKKMRLAALPVLGLALMSPMFVNCSSAEDLKDLAEGCDKEYNALVSGDVNAIASLDVNASTKALIKAGADLQALGEAMIKDTSDACTAMATDLGVTDTWTAKGKPASPEYTKEVCAQVVTKINAIMTSAKAEGQCTFSASIEPTEIKCEANLSAQASCEGDCKVDASCTEPKMDVRCQGSLSGKCSGECKGEVTCQASATVDAKCEGTCDAQCTGSCSGACEGKVEGGCEGSCEGTCDGQATPAGGQANCTGVCEGKCSKPAASATCSGQCSATCKGTCSGGCKLDANATVKCDGAVSCSGGCSVEYTEPTCEGTVQPPQCKMDANCQAACNGSVTAKAVCTKPSFVLVYNCTGTADIAGINKLVATLRVNMPKILVNAQARGQAAVGIVGSAFGAIEGTISGAANISGKGIACLKSAIAAQVNVKANVSVSVEASASVSGSASGGTK